MFCIRMDFIKLFVFFFIANLNALNFIDEFKAANLYEKGDYDKSQTMYENSLINNPNDFNTMYNLANIFYKKNEFEKAEKYYKKIVDSDLINSKKEQASFNLANSLAQQNKLTQALESYKKVLEFNSLNERAKKNIAIIKQMLEEEKKKQEQEKKDQEDKKQQEKDQQKDQDQNDKQDKDKQDKDQKEKNDNEQSEKNKSDQKQNDTNKDKQDKKDSNKEKSNQKDNQKEEDKDKNSKPEQVNKKDSEGDKQQAMQAAKNAEIDDKFSKEEKELLMNLDEVDKQVNKAIMKYKNELNKQDNNDQKNW